MPQFATNTYTRLAFRLALWYWWIQILNALAMSVAALVMGGITFGIVALGLIFTRLAYRKQEPASLKRYFAAFTFGLALLIVIYYILATVLVIFTPSSGYHGSPSVTPYY